MEFKWLHAIVFDYSQKIYTNLPKSSDKNEIVWYNILAGSKTCKYHVKVDRV